VQVNQFVVAPLPPRSVGLENWTTTYTPSLLNLALTTLGVAGAAFTALTSNVLLLCWKVSVAEPLVTVAYSEADEPPSAATSVTVPTGTVFVILNDFVNDDDFEVNVTLEGNNADGALVPL
jgi:hypothetical protein